jgi:hypothetical protein
MGEQFLNFPLHPSLQRLCGVYVRPYISPQLTQSNWLHWTRCMMGLQSSPYFAVQGTHLAEEVVVGEVSDISNPFHWERVALNLPGHGSYDPSQPWVQKVRYLWQPDRWEPSIRQ